MAGDPFHLRPLNFAASFVGVAAADVAVVGKRDDIVVYRQTAKSTHAHVHAFHVKTATSVSAAAGAVACRPYKRGGHDRVGEALKSGNAIGSFVTARRSVY